MTFQKDIECLKMSDNKLVSLTLQKRSWDQIFETLKWEGLGTMSKELEESYFKQTGEYYSRGNFWAAIQELQRQFEERNER